jgi:PKD repeat protein
MKRAGTRPNARRMAAVFAFVGLASVFSAFPTLGALPATTTPELSLNRTIGTSPFTGSSVVMKDNEGSAYVARDNSLWLADDDGRALREVDASTGKLKRTIDKTELEAVGQYGAGTVAGAFRYRDLESLAYDQAGDILYAFSGSCCNDSVQPTVFRLVRQATKLQLDSFQPLPPGTDNTASGWNPGDRNVYVGHGKNIKTYTYTTNTFGGAVQVTGLSGMLGMGFSTDGADLFVTDFAKQLRRVDWSSKTLVSNWTFDLTPFGVKDPRAVEVVGDQLYVSDGYDARPAGDPLAHAVFVFDVRPAAYPPTAAFSVTPTSGDAPLTVQFTDTSTGGATSWSWDFGDGHTSTAQNPSHLYTDPGTFTVTLTASNSNGSSTASTVVEASAPPTPGTNLLPNPDFETDTDGWNTNGFAAVTLERASDGHSGSWSAKITNTGTSTVSNTLNDSPNAVPRSSIGTYTASIWVRSDTATAGAKLYLRIREYQAATKVAETIVPVTLTTTWQQVTATITPVAPGSSSIDFAAVVFSAPPGSTFFADDANLVFN